MAQLVVAAAGAAIGFVASGGNPLGAQAGWAIGSAVGGMLFNEKQRSQGPRLEDLKVVGSAYGTPIPWVRGTARIAGQIWWASEKREIATTTSGGKGGGPEVTSYTYEVDLLIGLTDCEIVGVGRIWANGKLVYNLLTSSTPETQDASRYSTLWTRLAVYTGDAAQLPDTTYEAAVTDAPAYRGRSYVVIEGLQLGSGGQIPNLTFEVIASGSLQGDPYMFDETDTVRPVVNPFENSYPTTVTASYAKFGEAAALGQQNNGVYFTATNSDAAFDFGTDDFSVRAWVYCVSYASVSRPIVAHTRTNGAALAQGWSLFLNGGFLCAQLFNNNANIYSGGSPQAATQIPLNQLVCVGLEKTGSTLNVIQDGVVVATKPLTSTEVGACLTTDPLVIGFDLRGSWGVFNGYIDEVEISRVARGSSLPTARFEVDANTVFLWRADALNTITPDTDTLQETVEAICLRAGLSAGQVDASALASITKPVRSLAVGQVAPARPVLEQLQAGYFFECSLRDKLYFRPRAQSSVAAIVWDDMAAGPEQAASEPLPLTLGTDIEQPPQVALSYVNVNADFEVASEYSDRVISGQAATTTVQLAIGFTPAEAKGIADAIVIDGAASLLGTSLALPMSYAKLEAGDVVTVTDEDAVSYRLRLVRKTDERGVLAFEAVRDDATAIVSAQITDESATGDAQVLTPSATEFSALDIPILRDADDDAGYYVAARGTSATWGGTQFQSSVDDVTFTTLAEVSESAVLGTCTTVLGNYSGVGFDEVNSVTVNVAHGTLSSSTREAMLLDRSVNVMLIGSEVIRFRDAALQSAGIYKLTGLLRGQRGTEWVISTHSSGEVAALLRPQGVRRVASSLEDLNKTRYVRAVTLGGSVASATSEVFINTGEGAKPFAPVDLRVRRDDIGTFLMTWKRRTRYASSFCGSGGIAVPLGEASERYEVDIMNGSTVLRTIEATEAAVQYTPAQQVADWGAVQASVVVRVYQIGAAGRGRYLQATAQTSYSPSAPVDDIALSGAFVSGVQISVFAGSTLVASYVTQVSDTNLAGVATSLAAAIDATANYSATVPGGLPQTVRITGGVGAVYEITVIVSGDSSISASLTTAAAVASVGESFISNLYVTNAAGGSTSQIPVGTTFGFRILDNGAVVRRIEYTVADEPVGIDGVMVGLQFDMYDAANFNAVIGAGYRLYPRSGAAVGYYGSFEGPIGVTGVSLDLLSASPPYVLTSAVQQDGSAPVVADVSQVSAVTIAGTVAVGEVFTITLDGVDYSHTAIGGDTPTSVATALAATIDATSYSATSSVGTVSITGPTAGVSFVCAARITRRIVATVS